MRIETPGWVRDAVFYQIIPDRFAKSDRVRKPSNLEPWESPPTVFGFKGGDLLGIVEHLDYLERLGVNALYLNPIFQSPANHRYHTHDYKQVDPILGGNDALEELLRAAHTTGIRVVLDGVFNHASRGFYQFQHTLENGADSPYLDWFHFDRRRLERRGALHAYPGRTREENFQRTEKAVEKLGYQAWHQLPALPKFNTDTEAVRRFIFEVARHWIGVGIDGWRLDVPYEIEDDSFWREFRHVVKTANAEAYIVGEVWQDAERWLRGDQFDAVMNYVFSRACLGFFGGENLDVSQRPGGYSLESMRAIDFAHQMDRLLKLHDWEISLSQLNLLGSHDMPRFLTLVDGNERALELATLFQMTFPGAPSIYYGDEVGLEGGDDPDCRRTFPWEESSWKKGLLGFFQRAIALRHAHPALRRGDYRHLHADNDYNVYAFARHGERETLIVVLNNGTENYDLDLPADGLFPENSLLTDIWGDASARVVEGRITRATLSPASGAVLVPRNKSQTKTSSSLDRLRKHQAS